MNDKETKPPLIPLGIVLLFFLVAVLVSDALFPFEVRGPEHDLYPMFLRNSVGDERTFEESWPDSRGAGLLVAVSLARLVVDDPVAAARAISVAAGLAFVFFGGLLAFRMTGRRDAAVLTAVTLALSDSVQFYSSLVSTDMLFAAATTAGFWRLFADAIRPGLRAAFGAGLLFGLAYVTRYQAVLFFACGLVVVASSSGTRSNRFARSGAYLAGAALAVGCVAAFCAVTGLYEIGGLSGRGLFTDTSLKEIRESVGNGLSPGRSLYFGHGLMQFVFATSGVMGIAALAGPALRRVRFDRRSQASLAAAILYFLAVGWHHAHNALWYTPTDSVRYYLPLLPLVFAAAIENLLRIRSTHLRRIALGVVLCFLLLYSGWRYDVRRSMRPEDSLRFARAMVERDSSGEPLIWGYPPELALVFTRFAPVFLEYLYAERALPDPSPPLLPQYDYLVLPDDIAEKLDREQGPDNWLRAGHEPVFCAYRYCAYRRIGDGAPPDDGP